MLQHLKTLLYRVLRWSERYTKTDMVYFAGGQFWLALGRAIGVGSGIALTIVFANFLDPAAFGTYKYVLAAAGFVGAFTLGGLGGAVARAVATGNSHVVPHVFRTYLLWSIPATLAASGIAAYYFLNGNTMLGVGFLLASASILSGATGLYKSVMLGMRDFRGLALSTFRATIPVAGLIAVVLLTENVVAILATYFTLTTTLGIFMYFWTIRHYAIAPRPDGGPQEKETVLYGKHLSIMGSISQASDSLDQLLLWHFAGPAQLATYALALTPVREMRSFSQNIYPLIFPKYAVKTVQEMKASAPLRVKQFALVSACFSIAYIFAAPLLYQYVFPQYVSAIVLSQILAAGLVLQAKGIVEAMLDARGDTRLRYPVVLATQGAKVFFWVLLIPPYGMLGAVLGMIAADLVSSLALWRAYRKLK